MAPSQSIEDVAAQNAINLALGLAQFAPGSDVILDPLAQWGQAQAGGASLPATQQTAPSTPPVEEKRSGIKYVLEYVGPEGADFGDKQGVLFNTFKAGSWAVTIGFLVVVAAVVGIIWYLMQPAPAEDKKKKATKKSKNR